MLDVDTSVEFADKCVYEKRKTFANCVRIETGMKRVIQATIAALNESLPCTSRLEALIDILFMSNVCFNVE